MGEMRGRRRQRIGLAAAYDDLARSYAANRGSFDVTDVLTEFRQRLPAVGDLLDLGCGAGEPVASSFLAHGWAVTGVDISAEMLALARDYAPDMTHVVADMRDAQFPRESFDAVTAVYSLFHVPAEDHPELFRSVKRWLRPGGLLLFTYATAAYTGQQEFDGTLRFMDHDLPYSHVTPAALYQQLADTGLVVRDAVERPIGGETFLWVTAAAPG